MDSRNGYSTFVVRLQGEKYAIYMYTGDLPLTVIIDAPTSSAILMVITDPIIISSLPNRITDNHFVGV